MDDKPRIVRYHELFDCDVREAAGWYDRRVSGLGDSFVNEVRASLDDLLAHPLRYPKSASGCCRYIRIGRFPYVVLYDVTDSEILILGALHTARSIDKWRERLHDP